MMVWKGCSESLANKFIVHLSQIKREILVYSLVESLTFNFKGLCWAVLDWKINHIFSNLEGGSGVPPPKILKTKKAGEAISGHLPSVNEQFQRILLPFIECSFFKYKI